MLHTWAEFSCEGFPMRALPVWTLPLHTLLVLGLKPRSSRWKREIWLDFYYGTTRPTDTGFLVSCSFIEIPCVLLLKLLTALTNNFKYNTPRSSNCATMHGALHCNMISDNYKMWNWNGRHDKRGRQSDNFAAHFPNPAAEKAWWRNGSAVDSRSKGCGFKSHPGQNQN